MEQFRKIKFQNLVMLYSLCLIVVFILVAVIFIVNIRIEEPKQMRGYYVSVDGVNITEQGLIIPWGELDRRVVTKQGLHSFFAPYYMAVIIRTTWIASVISLLLSFVFAHILTRRIIKPIEETANSLKNVRGKTNFAEIAFPKELSDIEVAFQEAQKEIACLYADFENLSSFISHEQRNFLALLRAMIQNECPAVGERATAQLDRMVKSLDDILTLSENESKLEKVDLCLICGMAADEYKRIYKDLSFDFDEDATLYIIAHERMVYRAVSNLIENAIKYGADKPIAVYVGTQKGCPYVSVEDQGIGICMEQQEKIFESRYRIGSRKKDGYGIGLSLVRHVAELCGGFVWVDSKQDCGSKFKIVFPAFTPD
ncbi:MAG: HAMP domain-containing histidine kinase [Lachnospiraceae bacterium]|nr:HAMP domain-containing histidine kinase [Lachnospiraceae bacterium]